MTRDEYKARILAGPDCPEKRFLEDRQRSSRPPAKVEPKPIAPAPVVPLICSQGHQFTQPSRRSPVGCCPECTGINTCYRVLRPEDVASRPFCARAQVERDPTIKQYLIVQGPLCARAQVERIKNPPKLEGPVRADEAFWSDKSDLGPASRPEEPGATETEEEYPF